MANARSISPELQEHMDSGATTLAALVKVTPKDPKYASFGITRLDIDVEYDDGNGPTVYYAMIGTVMQNMVGQSTMEVGNSQSKHLVPAAQFNIDVSEELIRAGVYDWADYVVYIINYEDHTMGHWIPPAGFGQTGQLSVDDRGMSFIMEMTDLTKVLKQTIVEKDSITCRADYGSQPIGSSDSNQVFKEQRFPCGATLTWSATQTVTSVGLEANITFTASGLGAAADAYVPGMVEWLSGSNEGRSLAVEYQDGSGTISLGVKTQFPVEIGDTFRIRHDCTKWIYGTHGCKENFGGGDEWKLHYRGEPFIPISDADSINTPGATVGTGSA